MEKFLKTFQTSYKSFKSNLKTAKEKKSKIPTEIAKERENPSSLDRSSRYAPCFFDPAPSKTASPEEVSAAICARLERNYLL